MPKKVSISDFLRHALKGLAAEFCLGAVQLSTGSYPEIAPLLSVKKFFPVISTADTFYHLNPIKPYGSYLNLACDASGEPMSYEPCFFGFLGHPAYTLINTPKPPYIHSSLAIMNTLLHKSLIPITIYTITASIQLSMFCSA